MSPCLLLFGESVTIGFLGDFSAHGNLVPTRERWIVKGLFDCFKIMQRLLLFGTILHHRVGQFCSGVYFSFQQTGYYKLV